MTRPRRGVALVLVLWLVVVLGTIGATVVTATRTSSSLAGNLRARAVARHAAESGIEMMRGEIEDSLATLLDPADRAAWLNALERESTTRDSVALGEARFAVVVADPGARLDVNAAPAEHLARLFAHFTDAGRASALAALIRDRIERTGASAAPPAGASPRLVAPLRTLEELRTIPGADDVVLRQAAPFLTVDGDGTINRAAAPEVVLAAAFGELRDEPSRLVLIARGWESGHPLTHEIQGVFAISNDRLVLVHWRERLL